MINAIGLYNPTRGDQNKPQPKFMGHDDKIYHQSNKVLKAHSESSNKWGTAKTLITLSFGLICLAVGLFTKNNKYAEGLEGLFKRHLKVK